MKTSDELVIEYAENRAELRAVKKELSKIPNEAFEAIHGEAEGWKEARKDDDNYTFEPWPGWIGLLDEGDYYDEGHCGSIYLIAELWEKRKKLGYDLGKIRRAIAARGRKLLKEMS